MKKIYGTISGLSKSQKEFARTEKSLQSLGNILVQIQRLAHEPPRPDDSPINNTRNSSHNHEDFFENLRDAVQICADDLDPLARKAEKWKAAQQSSRWSDKVAGVLHMYIKNSGLREIDEAVSKHVCDERKINGMTRHHADMQIARSSEYPLEHSWLVRFRRCQRST